MPLRQTSTFQKQNLILFILPRSILHLPYGYLSVSQFMFYRKNALFKKKLVLQFIANRLVFKKKKVTAKIVTAGFKYVLMHDIA